MVATTAGVVLFWPGTFFRSTSASTFVMPSAAFTMESWFKWTVVASNTGILSNWNGGNGSMLLIDVGTGQIRLYCNSSGIDSITPTAGLWYHVVGSYDGTNRRLYVNGNLLAGPSSGVTPSAGGVALATGQYGGANFANGISADVAIYSRALTPGEIHDHYVYGSISR
jgi:hypothetical protein